MRRNRLVLATVLAVVLAVLVGQTASAAHAVWVHGTGHLNGTYSVDFDTGIFNGVNGNDMMFAINSTTDRVLRPNGSAAIRKMGLTRPTYAKCSSVTLSSTGISVSSAKNGTWFCFRTLFNRFVRFRLDHIYAYPGGLDITYRTWAY